MSRMALIVMIILTMSCNTVPAKKTANTASTDNPESAITQEAQQPHSSYENKKPNTIVDIQNLVGNLNTIIRNKNFIEWKQYLDEEYIRYYSTPEILLELSTYPILKKQGIHLTSLQDYFIYVVYPAHQNDRVDDIDYITSTHIIAITLSKKGKRLILYDLKLKDDKWKISLLGNEKNNQGY